MVRAGLHPPRAVSQALRTSRDARVGRTESVPLGLRSLKSCSALKEK